MTAMKSKRAEADELKILHTLTDRHPDAMAISALIEELAAGDREDEVRELLTELVGLGLVAIDVDGDEIAATRQAIRYRELANKKFWRRSHKNR